VEKFSGPFGYPAECNQRLQLVAPCIDQTMVSFRSEEGEELVMKKACSAGLVLTAALCVGRLSAQEQLRLPAALPDQPPQASPVLPVAIPSPPEASAATPPFLEIWDHANGWLSVTPPNLWPHHDMGLHASCANTLLYTESEYLLWWMKEAHLPPLVTTGSLTDPAPAVLGQPGTSSVFGDSVKQSVFSGGRFTLGSWLGEPDLLALEGVFLFLGDRSFQSPTVSAPGLGNSPVLGRPIVDPVTGQETIEPIAAPNEQSGAVRYSFKSEFWGMEGNLKTLLASGCWYRTEILAGFRFLDLQERLTIGQSESFAPAGSSLSAVINDDFQTTNHFYGGQVGTSTRLGWKCWTLDFTGKVALGSTIDITRIDGITQLTQSTGGASILPGGILAAPSNSGRFRSTTFSVVPETGISAGWQINDHLRAHVGYTYLCWTSVARPGDQIDRVVNVSQLPTLNGPGVLVGPARPAVPFDRTTFWAQGLDFGFEFSF
jgi:Putative beta barrel porin-7 (BBP7)